MYNGNGRMLAYRKLIYKAFRIRAVPGKSAIGAALSFTKP